MVHIPRQEPNRHSFAPITSTDHRGYIWVTAVYTLIFCSLVFITRSWIKRNSWGSDDTVFAAAVAAQLGHVVAIFVALKNGLGRVPGSSTYPERRDEVLGAEKYKTGGQASFAAMIFLIVSLTLTKISLLLFMHRLMTSQSKKVLKLSYALISLSAAWGLSSIIAIGVNCSSAMFLGDESTKGCRDMGAKWIGIATIDGLTEIIIMAIPMAIVWPLKMSRDLKFQAFSAFLFRIGVIAAAIVHAIYVKTYTVSQHPSLAMVPAIVAAEAELCWSLVSATIPNLKNFMKSFATGFGHEFGLGTLAWPDRARTHAAPTEPQKGKRFGSSIPLGRISKKIWHPERPGDFVSDPQSSGYATEVSRTLAHNLDTDPRMSGGSEEFIIRKDVTMTVDHEQGLRERNPV